ncbi:GNAT family N-acetyltransferase [Nitrospirillum amazonense]|uniref:Ribosomal protein S18 acetylase RimI-like enzyme n=1 Tax=Nitrospirillum amazonense TaxID=28077 RepID=A0A560JLA8_9PROT|nr:GNAT family N-acetyltransferase [Nitrospirillum amazonense]MDG3442894.1 GNAT family N-acetyltransferase [Nitrospirillum amazonense]TWB71961.1 ribosomal protein S18 acetylase RimI-like enzyme [Nitrospirillum amazonense]
MSCLPEGAAAAVDDAAPVLPPLTLPADLAAQGLSLRDQGEGDADFVRDLYVSHRWEEMQAAPWTDGERLAFLQDQARLQAAHYALHYHDADFMIVEKDGRPIGRLYLFRRNVRDLRIVEIGLMPDWRGHGLGGALLGWVQGLAREEGYAQCTIHVEGNNRARRLYQRLGFQDVEPVGPYFLMAWLAAPAA